MSVPEDQVESRIASQASEHADLMLLGRLKYLSGESQSGLIETVKKRLEQRIGRDQTPGTGSDGATPTPEPPKPAGTS